MAERRVDFYALDDLLTPEEREIRDRLRDFCAREVTPVASRYWEAAEFPFELIPKMAGLNLAGGTIEGYGCPGMSWVAAGLVAQEWARSDGSVGTFFGVHSFLAMQTIGMLGSEEQKRALAAGDGAAREDRGVRAHRARPRLGLRRPGDVARAATATTTSSTGASGGSATRSFADHVIVWARGEDGEVGGYVVDKGTPGFHTRGHHGQDRAALLVAGGDRARRRARPGGEPAGRLPTRSRTSAKVLTSTRYTVAWRALGLAMAAFELARDHALEREQFGKPIASFQLVQDKLSRMLAEVTTMQLLCWRRERAGRARGGSPDGMASLAKLNNAAKARSVVADARDILGGDGILLEHHVARHFADMEAVFTFEGTDSIQSLIVGREITGIQAISAGGKRA